MDREAGQHLARLPSPTPGAGETSNAIEKAPLETAFSASLVRRVTTQDTGRKGCAKGKGIGGKHQASGPSRPCLSRVNFFFNPKVKVFLFETSIYIPESKKKKKAAKLQAYICPQPRHRHSISAAQGEHS